MAAVNILELFVVVFFVCVFVFCNKYQWRFRADWLYSNENFYAVHPIKHRFNENMSNKIFLLQCEFNSPRLLFLVITMSESTTF